MKLIAVFLAASLLCGSTLAQELQLEDFANKRGPEADIRNALSAAGIGLESLSMVIVANDNCELGWTPKQLELIRWNVDFLGVYSTPENGVTPDVFSEAAMGKQWEQIYSHTDQAAVMAVCETLKQASQAARSQLQR